jgi:hypothetical protein
VQLSVSFLSFKENSLSWFKRHNNKKETKKKIASGTATRMWNVTTAAFRGILQAIIPTKKKKTFDLYARESRTNNRHPRHALSRQLLPKMNEQQKKKKRKTKFSFDCCRNTLNRVLPPPSKKKK